MPLHERLEPLAFLLGKWSGNGRGHYPTIEDFAYGERSEFSHTGRPFLLYSQHTWHPETQQPMHSETGFIRALGGGRVEMLIAHAFGVTEMAEGTVSGTTLETTSTALASTATAKTVEAVTRRFEVTGNRLHYEIGMAFGGHPLQAHLDATLGRLQGSVQGFRQG